jgi:hypothetical protein
MAAARLPLQRPLVDPPPPPPVTPKPEVVKPASAPAKPQPKPPQIVLVGTFTEAGTGGALIQTGKTKVEVRRPGESLEGAPDVRLIDVKANGITVSFQGANFDFSLPSPGQAEIFQLIRPVQPSPGGTSAEVPPKPQLDQ